MTNQEEKASNDLLAPACLVEPRIAVDLKRLSTITKQEIHLSGSGSTMYGICDNAEHATMLAKKIEEQTDLIAISTHTF
jgi:4-diphosphocytidyl-2C-methyl-D-erythritol kinase